MTLLVVVVVLVVVNVPLNAGIFLLACRVARLTEISFRRALGITLLVFVTGWPVLLLVLAVGWFGWEVPPRTLARWTLPLLSLVVPLTIHKWTLGQPWGRTLVVFVVWRVLTLGQSGLVLVGLWQVAPELLEL